MITITIPDTEMFDESTNEIFEVHETTLKLEHSLISVSKWESKYKKPFLSTEQKTLEETLYYIQCMTITQNVNPDVYRCIPQKAFEAISDYIQDPMTATWFTEQEGGKNRRLGEVITSEIIYYWMIALQIPVEFQTWHLNRLLTLIRVCNEKQKPPKKMSKKDIMQRNASLNAARRAKNHSKG